MKDIIGSLKEFVWDIIGYLIPGAFLLIILNFCVNPELQVPNNFLFDWEYFDNTLIIILSYVLGYLIYSLTNYKIYIQDRIINLIEYLLPKGKYWLIKFIKNRHSKSWEQNFKNSELFKTAVSKIQNEFPSAERMEINEIRNILMSKNSSQSKIIYTFMFRASIFDHVSTIFLLIIFTFILQLISPLDILKDGVPFNYIYFLMFLMIPLLGNSKRFFFPKAMRIPFSNL